MELKHTTVLDDYIDAGLLSRFKQKSKQYKVIGKRIILPILLIVLGINLVVKGILYLSIVGVVWFFACFMLVSMMIEARTQKKYKTYYSELIVSKPHLLEERHLSVKPQEVQITFTTKEITTDIKHVLDYNNKLYLYGDKYAIVDIIPHHAYASVEEMNLFLEQLDVQVEKVKNSILLKRVH